MKYQLTEYLGMGELTVFATQLKEPTDLYPTGAKCGKDYWYEQSPDNGSLWAIFTHGMFSISEVADAKEVKKDNQSLIQSAKRARQHKIAKGE